MQIELAERDDWIEWTDRAQLSQTARWDSALDCVLDWIDQCRDWILLKSQQRQDYLKLAVVDFPLSCASLFILVCESSWNGKGSWGKCRKKQNL